MIPFSVLDLCPIVEGGNAAQAFRNALDLAQHVEQWGYQRYWVAEHHSIRGVASAAGEFLDSTLDRYADAFCFGAAAFLLRGEPLALAASLAAFGAAGFAGTGSGFNFSEGLAAAGRSTERSGAGASSLSSGASVSVSNCSANCTDGSANAVIASNGT